MPDKTERFDSRNAMIIRRDELREEGKQHISHFTDYEELSVLGTAKTVWFLVYQEPYPTKEVQIGQETRNEEHEETAVRQESEVTYTPEIDPSSMYAHEVVAVTELAAVPTAEYEQT